MPDPMDDSTFSTMSTVVFSFIAIVFVLVIGTIIVRAIQGGRQWNANNHAPVLNRRARVMTKRTDVQHRSGTTTGTTHTSGSTTTTYFVTMQDEQSGDRHEFRVNGREYGMLAEGDVGVLTSQGTRYQGFVRE